MSQTEKAKYFKALKAAGVKFDHHYRDYSTEDLKKAWADLSARAEAAGETLPPLDGAAPAAPPLPPEPPVTPPAPQQEPPPRGYNPNRPDAPEAFRAPVAGPDPDELPGQRLNTHTEDEILRVDELGRAWLQEEVLKPAVPRPRGRRVLTYQDTGVVTQTVQAGEYTESFEVAGTGEGRPAQIKITLPSYQVGIYRDPRFPFKVVTYGGNEGFELFEVRNYYGGMELVPQEIKLVYVSNVLCYDIRTTIRAIEAEYRRLQLSGKVD